MHCASENIVKGKEDVGIDQSSRTANNIGATARPLQKNMLAVNYRNTMEVGR